MKEWCHTNNILQAHCWGCLIVQVMFHTLMTSLMTAQSRPNFEIDLSPSIYELERRSLAQNIGNANGYLSGIFNFRYPFRWKSLSRAQNGGHFENFEILNTTSIWPQTWNDRPKLCLKVGPLYSLINEMATFVVITKKRARISSLSFLCIGSREIMTTFM